VGPIAIVAIPIFGWMSTAAYVDLAVCAFVVPLSLPFSTGGATIGSRMRCSPAVR